MTSRSSFPLNVMVAVGSWFDQRSDNFRAAVLILISIILLGYGVAAFSQTAITFEDGTVVTTEQNVYVSEEPLYRIVEADPVNPTVGTPEVPEVPQEPAPEPSRPFTHGFNGTCGKFDPSVGLTFEFLDWQDQCDGNKDGKYDFCEDYSPFQSGYTFVDQEWQRTCR